MKKLTVYLGLVLMIALALPSCTKEVADENATTETLKTGTVETTDACGTPKVVNLYGGQTILVGNVAINNDKTNLYVTYTATGGWSFTELHLYVGDIALLPINNAMNPMPGHFPYTIEDLPFPTYTYTFTIPLAGLPECFEVVAHAVVTKNGQTETGWLLEKSFKIALGTRHWGGFATYCKQECEMVCAYNKAWVTGVQRTSIPFQGYYNLYTPGGDPIVANIVDFSSRKPGAQLGTVTYTDDAVNLIVNINMNSGYYASQYYSYFGSNAAFTPYITTINGVNVMGLPIHDVLADGIANYTYTVPLSDLTTNADGSILLVQFMYFCKPVAK